MKTIGFTLLPVILLCVLVIGQCNGQSNNCRRTKRPGDNCTTASGDEGICASETNCTSSTGRCAFNGRCAPLKCIKSVIDVIYHDCLDIKNDGETVSGVYTLTLESTGETYDAFCDMETDGGGWTVFQNRFDGSVDFYRNFQDYQNGFGPVNGEYWLGLDYIHALTVLSSQIYIKVVDAADIVGYQKWNTFSVGAGPGFVMNVGGLSENTAGSNGQDIGYNNGSPFSTYDSDNDGYPSGNCAELDQSGWWHNVCTFTNLNGPYVTPGDSSYTPGTDGNFNYRSFRVHTALKESKLMVRRN